VHYLTAQHRDFVTEDQDFDVLGGGAAAKQPKPAEHRDRDQIQQSKQHGPRSCHDHIATNTRSPQVTSFGTVQERRCERSLGLCQLRGMGGHCGGVGEVVRSAVSGAWVMTAFAICESGRLWLRA
jgi:hypothetical protein